MSYNTSAESSNPTSSNPSINPALQAVLGSLEVHLEEELARYRRQRAGRPVMSPRGLGRHQIRKPLELIAVNQGGKKTQRPALGMSKAPAISFPLVMVNPDPIAASPQAENPAPMPQTELFNLPLADATESASSLVASSSPNANASHSANGEQPTLLEKQTDMGGGLVPLAAAQEQPEDYLESSEKLLQSLAEEGTDTAPQQRSTPRFLTPLGVGSILLLLLSSATLVYLVTNPSTLSALGLNRFFGSKTTTTAQKPTATTSAEVTPVEELPALKGPDLAAEEFPEVSLDTLSHLEVSPTPPEVVTPPEVPTVADVPAAQVTEGAPPVIPNSALPAGPPSDLSTVLLPPSIQSGAAPSRVAPVAPLPAPPAAVAPTIKSKASPAKPKNTAGAAKQTKAASPAKKVAENPAPPKQGDYYYVVTNYRSDRDLEQARTIVPDAYIDNLPNGTKIQMGAFKRESEAKTLVQELKKQGITASIYAP